MIDKALLKYHMMKHGDRQEDLAKALNLRQSGISTRINGQTDFRTSEMNAIRKRYALSAEEMQAIFFAS